MKALVGIVGLVLLLVVVRLLVRAHDRAEDLRMAATEDIQ